MLQSTPSNSILKDSFFESTNAPLETWIVVLDSWIKGHKLQGRALIEKKVFYYLIIVERAFYPPPRPPPPLPPFLNALPTIYKNFFSNSYTRNDMSIINLDNLFTTFIIDDSVVTIIQVYK